MERASYVVDYNQLSLGCNPVVWKKGTCWIDQRGRVRKRSVPLQSSFGINTKVCSLLLVLSTFPPESSTTNTRAYTHCKKCPSLSKLFSYLPLTSYTSQKRFNSSLPQGFSLWPLFVCLWLAGYLKSLLIEFNEVWWKVRPQAKKQTLSFWCGSRNF